MTKQDELQSEFVEKGVKFFRLHDRGYYNLAMRFGKCKTTLNLIDELDGDQCTILIAYPDNKLKETWQSECEQWGYANPNITYVNFSSLKKHVTHCFDFFVIDEFHSCSENEIDYAHEIMDNCDYTLGLSGTVSDDTREKWDLEEIASYTTLDGIKDGILADYQITVHVVDLDDSIKVADKNGKLKTEKQKYSGYTWVIEKLKRDGGNFMHLALARNRLSLASIGKMNYTKALLNHLSDKRVIVFTGLSSVADSMGVPSYHSKSKDESAYKGFQEGKHNHLALAAMGKVGVTYKNLDSVILLNFTYNAEESSQILNRAIKLDYQGKMADLHIICLNEPPELKKIKESLSMLDTNKIKYI
jgi:superfamily II DNA or RNA helicase